jgi:hypothetical protein
LCVVAVCLWRPVCCERVHVVCACADSVCPQMQVKGTSVCVKGGEGVRVRPVMNTHADSGVCLAPTHLGQGTTGGCSSCGSGRRVPCCGGHLGACSRSYACVSLVPTRRAFSGSCALHACSCTLHAVSELRGQCAVAMRVCAHMMAQAGGGQVDCRPKQTSFVVISSVCAVFCRPVSCCSRPVHGLHGFASRRHRFQHIRHVVHANARYTAGCCCA